MVLWHTKKWIIFVFSAILTLTIKAKRNYPKVPFLAANNIMRYLKDILFFCINGKYIGSFRIFVPMPDHSSSSKYSLSFLLTLHTYFRFLWTYFFPLCPFFFFQFLPINSLSCSWLISAHPSIWPPSICTLHRKFLFLNYLIERLSWSQSSPLTLATCPCWPNILVFQFRVCSSFAGSMIPAYE